MEKLQAILGIITFCGIAWALSENRAVLSPVAIGKLVATGVSTQLLLAIILLKVPFITALVMGLNDAVIALESATVAGTSFVFGYLGGAKPPFVETHAGASFILGFRALPIVLLISALSALLFYWNILPWVVKIFAKTLQRVFGIGGALGISAAANIFVGMVEAPLLIRPYLKNMSRSELFAMMSVGMATIAGTVMALYATILRPVMPDALGHILIASMISAPAALMMAHLMVPSDGAVTDGDMLADANDLENQPHSAMEAVTNGTIQGAKLLINIAAMLIVMIALVHLVNLALALLPQVSGAAISLERLFGWIFSPLAWLMGIPWAEATVGGELLGYKTILNELIAYSKMAALPADALSSNSRVIMIYALCGFANFGSLGIMIGGLITIAPERRTDIVGLGPRTIISGLLATCMTGSIVGMIA